MSLPAVIRIFVFTIFFNLILPSGDVYSDIILMYQSWTFQTSDSLELSGCKACYHKTEDDLYTSQGDCQTCITQKPINCGGLLSAMNKLLEIESKNECNNDKWIVNHLNGTLWSNDCIDEYACCFETKDQPLKINNNLNKNMISIELDSRLLVSCEGYEQLNNEIYEICNLKGNLTESFCPSPLYDEHLKAKVMKVLKQENDVLIQKNFEGKIYKFSLKKYYDNYKGRYDLIVSDIVAVEHKQFRLDQILSVAC